MSKHVEVAHRRVGDLRVPEDDVIEVAYVPGFPDAHRFVLLQHSEQSPFLWMACLDDLDLVFAVTDPYFFFPDYDPKFGKEDLDAIDAKDRDHAAVLAIANLSGPVAALNLAAPLLLNRDARKATQVLLGDDRHSTRQPLPGQTAETGKQPATVPAEPTAPAASAAVSAEAKPERENAPALGAAPPASR